MTKHILLTAAPNFPLVHVLIFLKNNNTEEFLILYFYCKFITSSLN